MFDAESSMISEGNLIVEWNLTPALIAQIGHPDEVVDCPYIPDIQVRLYEEDRIRNWIKRRSKLVGLMTHHIVEPDYEFIHEIMDDFKIYKLPYDIETLERETAQYLQDQYGHNRITTRGLCSYIRHRYTNYEKLMETLGALAPAVSIAIKIVFTDEIIEHTGLTISTIEAVSDDRIFSCMEYYSLERPEIIALKILKLEPE